MSVTQHKTTVLAFFPLHRDEAEEVYDVIGRAIVMEGLSPARAVSLIRKELNSRGINGNEIRDNGKRNPQE